MSEQIPEFDESDLIQRAKSDPHAFGELYDLYVKKIYNYIYYRTGNHQDAEDLTARVFQRALQHIPNYQDRGVPFSAWLYRIAHNLVANWHRDQSRRKVVTLDESITTTTAGRNIPEKVAVDNQRQDQLLELIRQLPPERQQLIILKFVERMSNAEIGKIMGRSEGAVKSLYHRTLITLRNYIQSSEDDLF